MSATRHEAVYAADLGPAGIDVAVAAAVVAAVSSGVHVALAGVDDAEVAARRIALPWPDRLVVADADRSLVARGGGWTEGWSSPPDAGDLADGFDAWLLDHLWRQGIGPTLVAVATHRRSPTQPGWPMGSAQVALGGPDGPTLVDLLGRLVSERADGALPGVDASPGWCLVVDPDDRSPSVSASLLSLSDGAVGIRGDLEDAGRDDHYVLVAGAFGRGADGLVRPLPGPAVTVLGDAGPEAVPCRRVLDLHTGTLERQPSGKGLRTVRFASIARPGVVALRGEDDRTGEPWPPPLAPPAIVTGSAAAFDLSSDGTVAAVRAASGDAVVTAHAAQRTWDLSNLRRIERVAVVRADDGRHTGDHGDALAAARDAGFDRLLDEHRRAWARRWDAADIEIVGDAGHQQAIRYALFHLLSCAPTTGEAAVGARGLTGLAYAGHVFWDADVFVLPALAATIPGAARAMLEYRINRIGAARDEAARRGHVGARYPWESADTGHDVTPRSTRDVEGGIIAIRTGELEEHISADIAWALHHYLEWTADDGLMEAGGRSVVLDTARYWSDRVRLDGDGRGHLYGVIGPDEYHEVVDDDAYTNNLVRWHLRWAAALLRAEATGSHDEADALEAAARTLVDGFDPDRGCHEQFAGFWDLEPLVIADIAETPVAADLLLGRERVRRSQITKQPDVLMLHHLLPDACPPGSLHADLDVYLPRTAHGSSLSAAICAAQLARAGRADDGLALFDVAARTDLDDLGAMAAGGLHLAAMGGVWQAVVHGFGGVRTSDGTLVIDPHLPRRWEQVSLRLRHRGRPIVVTIDHDTVRVACEEPVPLLVAGTPATAPAHVSYSPEREESR